MDNTNYWSSLY